MNEETISVEEFSKILAQRCKDYTDEICKKVETGIAKIGKENAKEAKDTSPEDFGDYKKSWTTTIEKTSRGVIQATTHNKKYQLVHLLENGHLTRKGTGRIAGKGKEHTKAIIHVSTVQEHAEEKIDALLTEVIK